MDATLHGARGDLASPASCIVLGRVVEVRAELIKGSTWNGRVSSGNTLVSPAFLHGGGACQVPENRLASAKGFAAAKESVQ